MSIDWRKDDKYRRNLGDEVDTTDGWVTRSADTASGWLVWEERVIPAPGGRMARQRRMARLNGCPIPDKERDLFLGP